ncbi:MAG TPA: ATP-dependent metallopeptidase FtsH/Yme1/Tma family protein, partial [Blastocatellia bacterium]
MNSTVRQIIFWIVIICGALLLYRVVYMGGGAKEQALNYSQFVDKINAKQIKKATIEDTQITGELQSGENFKTDMSNQTLQASVIEDLRKSGADVNIKSGSSNMWLINVLSYGPVLILIGLWIFMMRQMQSGGNKALSFGKSRAKLLSNQQKRVT